MEKKLLSFLPVFLLHLFLHGQFIGGQVLDSAGAPVPFATVALMHLPDSAIVRGMITDEKGAFDFSPISRDTYFLHVQADGFEVCTTAAIYPDSTGEKNTVQVKLKPAAKTLDLVTINEIQSTIVFKGGNIIVNVENSALAKGNSVFDLLSRLPGISIENNTIMMQGKSGVIVMIDGKVQQVSNAQLLLLLKGMSAENVQRIELLKNPPVKYDAAGTSGMINIVTKRSEQLGFSGNVYAETSQGIYNNASYGLGLNYKNEKLSVFTSAEGSDNIYKTSNQLYRDLAGDTENTELDNKTDYKSTETGLNFKAGADWYLNKANIIGFKMDGGPGTYNENGDGGNSISGYNDFGFDHLNFSERGHNKWNTRNYNINAEHHFDTTGTQLDFSADYASLKESDMSLYESHYYNAAQQEVLVPGIFRISNQSLTQLFSSRLDFIHPIDTSSSIEAGIKASYAPMSNNYLFERKDSGASTFHTDPLFSTDYLYHEQNLAAYFNYSKSWKTFSMQLGLRGENTAAAGNNSTNASRFTKNYFSLFPNVSLHYSRSVKHVFQLNLNRRIDRPTFWDLNPFIVYRDPYSYFTGNPFLQPDFSHTAEFTYSFKEIISTSVSYSRVSHFMLDYPEQVDSTKILLETSKNIPFNQYLSGLLFIKYDFASWYEMMFSGTVSYLDYKGDIAGVPFRTKALSYRATFSNTFLLPGKTKLEFTALYRGPNLFGITVINPVWMASFALQRSFFKEKMECSLGMEDIFKTFKFHTHAQFDNQSWNFYTANDTRRIVLSISYNFGKAEFKERDHVSNAEEKERMNH